MAEVAEGTLVDGRYLIAERIGSGGMADVYCAEDAQLGRDVALKVLHRRFARDAEFVERFRREASAAASLQHPNVVSVFDRGEHDGTYYIAMENLHGRTLKQLIRDEAPLDQVRAIDLAIQVLEAAGFAHRRGVIHRDFKPHNVIVGDDERLKVTDFGIARAGASEMTETGSIMGTAHYLSPEQAQGRRVEEVSDLYSIGVILFELLTGEVPFKGESAVSIALKHVAEEPPRLRDIRPEVHSALESAVTRALAKDPAERYASAEEFIAALEAARRAIVTGANGQGTAVFAPVAPPPGPARRRRRWPLIALAALLIALAAGLLAWRLSQAPQVVVPSVVYEQLARAEVGVRRAGLHPTIKKIASAAAPGTVVSESPRAGTKVDKGSTVTLTVSGGPAKVAVPDVSGLPQAQATKALQAKGFKAAVDQTPSSTVARGIVIGTSPPARSLAPSGSTVHLQVSSGPSQVAVPSVVGEDQASATQALQASGFTVAVQSVNSDQQKGIVLAQSPSGGTQAPPGSQVTITVSKGKALQAVPNVVGQDQGTASSTLSVAGFSVRVVKQPSPAGNGKVVRQSPPGGSRQPSGATVTIYVATQGGGNGSGGGGPGSPPGGGAQQNQG